MSNVNRNLKSLPVWLTVACVSLGAAAIIICRLPDDDTPGKNPEPPPASRCDESEDWKSALVFQSQRNWSAAIAAWESVVNGLEDEKSPCRSEAEHHLRLCRDGENKDASEPASNEPITIAEDSRPSEKRPEAIPERTLEDEYPVGRVIRSISAVQISGRGTNRSWGLQSEGHFDWKAQVEATSRILESSPTRGYLKVRQEFHDVSQLLVVRNKSFSLDPTPTFVHKGLRSSIDTTFASDPAYRLLRSGMMVYEKQDPHFKRLLTGTLKQLGQDRDDWVLPEGTVIASQIDRISGAEIEFDYVSGFGVSKIRLVNADRVRLSQAELQNLAETLSLMLDYHVFPMRDQAVGEPWSMRVEDVAGLFAVQGLEAQASGTLVIQREPGEGDFAPLKVVSGAVDLQTELSAGRQQARLNVISGDGRFSLKDYFLERADIELRINSLWQNPRSLLFNTDAVRDLKARAVYRAENLTKQQETAVEPQ